LVARTLAGLPEENAAPDQHKIGKECSKLRGSREVRLAGIETGADDEVVGMPEQLVGVRRLQRDASRRGLSGGAIIFSQNRLGTEGIIELNSVQAVCRRRRVPKAQQGGIGPAWLGAGRIAILRLLVENSYMRRPFEAPVRCDIDLAQQVEIADLVGRGLWRGVGRTPIILQ
jgi:hypothetical protein